jgi:hypothetical protein
MSREFRSICHFAVFCFLIRLSPLFSTRKGSARNGFRAAFSSSLSRLRASESFPLPSFILFLFPSLASNEFFSRTTAQPLLAAVSTFREQITNQGGLALSCLRQDCPPACLQGCLVVRLSICPSVRSGWMSACTTVLPSRLLNKEKRRNPERVKDERMKRKKERK